jgi:hypothetical protein
MTSLENILDHTLADALAENNPEIARSIDKLIANGKGMREIGFLCRKVKTMCPDKRYSNLFPAIEAYARSKLKG